MNNRLNRYYQYSNTKDLVYINNYANSMDVPKIEKIIVSLSSKQAVFNKKAINMFLVMLTLITGQYGYVCKAKKSISGFKLRKGMGIGCKVILRNDNMYTFLDKLITIVLPRIKGFRGLSNNSFDHKGNYSFGIKDVRIFPEVEKHHNKFVGIGGMNITIVTSAANDINAQQLLNLYQFPIIKY